MLLFTNPQEQKFELKEALSSKPSNASAPKISKQLIIQANQNY